MTNNFKDIQEVGTMSFGKYFTQKDLERTSHELSEPNVIPEEQLAQNHWQIFMQCWVDPLNDWLLLKYGNGVRISSGFRNKELNNIVSGKPKSQHQGIPYMIIGNEVLACAVDLQWESLDNTKTEIDELFDSVHAFLRFDQLGKEHSVKADGSIVHWVHLSAFPFDPQFQRNMTFAV